jgi:TonB family protein
MAAVAADKTAAPNPKVVWAKTEGAPPERKPARAALPARPETPDAAKRALPWVVLSAAAGVLCAISVGAWLFIQEESVIAGEGERAAAEIALPSDAPADPAATVDAVPAAAVPTPDLEPVPAPTAAPPKSPDTSRPKAAAASRNEVTPTRKPVAAASSVTPAAAVGPVFEIRDVNESPRVATRVEPRLPAALRARKVNEVVIVRALVSPSGHPSQVSLLRRSKAGQELDDVVLAAVNEWTFSPARKKGEAVSCWFNFGVSVGRPE